MFLGMLHDFVCWNAVTVRYSSNQTTNLVMTVDDIVQN